MKKFFSWLLIIGIFGGLAWWVNPDLLGDLSIKKNEIGRVAEAFKNRESNVMVEVEGRVILLLPDIKDVKGALQQFVIELENGHRLLVSHNIDIAPAVPAGVSSIVQIKGEYDWSDTGGTIHWTHRDRAGERAGGWIEYNGTRYQ